MIQDELIKSINMFAPFIAENLTKTRILSTEEFIQMHRKVNDSVLGNLFDMHGSDKTRLHHYHSIYAPIIAEIKNPRKMLEIGLGTNNTSVLSNMGINGKPGASLRAFRDYMPNCICLGADIDEGILFKEERISTYPLDQTKVESFEALRKATGGNFDLMIDDGLHSINANLHSLVFFLQNLKVGGFGIIEDIPERSLDFWKVILNCLDVRFVAHIVQARAAYVFVVKKESS